jgi:hypothetical protein
MPTSWSTASPPDLIRWEPLKQQPCFFHKRGKASGPFVDHLVDQAAVDQVQPVPVRTAPA